MPDPISWSFALPYYLLALGFGYVLGSIPFGLILTRIFGAGDIRKIGSGNIGMTNVLRTGRKGLALATLLGDALKGTLAVFLASFYGPDPALIAGFGAFLGHLFPVWLFFRGGKGVATYLGVLLGLFWPLTFAFAGVWVVVAYLSRYSSLASLTATLSMPILLLTFGKTQLAELFAIMTMLVWIMHRANIRRLLQGTENRMGKSHE